MQVEDVESAECASAVTFIEADELSRRVSEPAAQPRSEAESTQWIDRARYFFRQDPAGCWVATDDSVVVGFALSRNRGRFWFLWTYGVLPSHQGKGTGKQLMDAVLVLGRS